MICLMKTQLPSGNLNELQFNGTMKMFPAVLGDKIS